MRYRAIFLGTRSIRAFTSFEQGGGGVLSAGRRWNASSSTMKSSEYFIRERRRVQEAVRGSSWMIWKNPWDLQV